MRRIVAIVGATATGKTALGETIAEAIGGEVVCADARQIFRGLDVGTGKPAAAELARRPHHLFDALELGDRASAGGWAKRAREVCESLLARGVTPVLVGGSGLYVGALVEGLNPEPPHAPETRARLLAELADSGPERMHGRLAAVDPVTAARLAPRDRQRIVRALEVHEASGRTLSWWHSQAPREGLAGDWRVLEVTCDPVTLAGRIEQRTRHMFRAGLPDEVRALLDRGLRAPLEELRAIGYDEALALVEGRMSQDEAESRTSARTRALAKRQRTWFRHHLAGTPLDATLASPGELHVAALAALGRP